MAKSRLGVVLLVPSPQSHEIDGLRRACGDGMLERVAAHLTLVPPVNVRLDEEAGALEVLRAAAAQTPTLRLRLGPPATFLPVSPTLYLAVDGAMDSLSDLRRRVFVAPLKRDLSYPWVPHVTLADEMAPEQIGHAVSALANYAIDVTFDRVHLLRENIDGDRRRTWEPVADIGFGPRVVIGRGGLPTELSISEQADPEANEFGAAVWAIEDKVEFPALAGSASRSFAVAARRGGSVVGLAVGDTRGFEAELRGLIVRESERGTGVGSQLLAASESLVVERGSRELHTNVPSGGRAEAFFRGRGWDVSSNLPRWVAGRDFVRLWRRLAGVDVSSSATLKKTNVGEQTDLEEQK